MVVRRRSGSVAPVLSALGGEVAQSPVCLTAIQEEKLCRQFQAMSLGDRRGGRVVLPPRDAEQAGWRAVRVATFHPQDASWRAVFAYYLSALKSIGKHLPSIESADVSGALSQRGCMPVHFAAMCGVSEMAVSHWRSEHVMPSRLWSVLAASGGPDHLHYQVCRYIQTAVDEHRGREMCLRSPMHRALHPYADEPYCRRLQEAVRRFDASLAVIAGVLGIHKTTLVAWRNGVQKVPERALPLLAVLEEAPTLSDVPRLLAERHVAWRPRITTPRRALTESEMHYWQFLCQKFSAFIRGCVIARLARYELGVAAHADAVVSDVYNGLAERVKRGPFPMEQVKYAIVTLAEHRVIDVWRAGKGMSPYMVRQVQALQRMLEQSGALPTVDALVARGMHRDRALALLEAHTRYRYDVMIPCHDQLIGADAVDGIDE